MSRLASGLRPWVWQRASAVYLLFYTVAAVVVLVAWPPASHEAWRSLMARPAVSAATAGFFWALLVHAWVGGRDVLIDYARPQALRLVLLALLGLFLGGAGLWALGILFDLHVGIG